MLVILVAIKVTCEVGAAGCAAYGAYAAARDTHNYFWPRRERQPTQAGADAAVVIPVEVPTHQEELREGAGLVHLNMLENNETIDTRRLAQQITMEEGIEGVILTTSQSREATTQLNEIIPALQAIANNTALDVETMRIEINRLLNGMALSLSTINQLQARLREQGNQFQQDIHHLKISGEQSTVEMAQANREIERLRPLHQNASGLCRDQEIIGLKNTIRQLSVRNTELNAAIGRVLQCNSHHQAQPTLAQSPDSVASGEHLNDYFQRKHF